MVKSVHFQVFKAYKMKIVNTIMKSVFANYAKKHWPELDWIVIGNQSDFEEKEFDLKKDFKIISDIIVEYEVWIIHRLFTEFAPLIMSFRKANKTVIIQTWGPDYLRGTGKYPIDKLEPLTRQWWIQQYHHTGFKKVWRELIVWKRWQRQIQQCLQLANSVHFCLPTETTGSLKIIESNLRFVYEPMSGSCSKRASIANTRKVLLGNSGDPTNNHLDALHALSHNCPDLENVLIPLSYAAPPGYAEIVEAEAQKLFGKSRVVILKDFLKPSEYNDVIQDYGTVMLYHIRQQAVGNFLIALEAGNNIILNRNGLLQKYALLNGIDLSQMVLEQPRYTAAHRAHLLSIFSRESTEEFLAEVKRFALLKHVTPK
jgi:hypothetical protein